MSSSMSVCYSAQTPLRARLGTVVLAIFITLLLFQLMAALLNNDIAPPPPLPPQLEVELLEPRADSAVQPKITLEPPPPPVEPPAQQRVDFGTEFQSFALEVTPAVPDIAISAQQGQYQPVADAQARPLVRVEPQYPVAAARDGVSGWVQLSFSIDATGAVTDVVVLDAEPKRVFEQAAIRALKRWKYQPSLEQGKAYKTTGFTVQLDFSLEP
ncbi:energy transducer TonB [Rheinheimera sp. 4Y26]|uniref:energy transducer TonB n=1 Tax=Rheinheimera sp. 4Y26 TaxID=2977811 RepID=UPI0021B0CFD1|nr:energy transducer TonB [Rheinheimera sp. 4Y26]MCT6700037.1 energy transducer TonB [Rheinheimera sp. 4Y26]